MAAAGGTSAGSAAAEFVFLPHRYLHASWRGDMLAEPVWQMLSDCPRTEGRLAAFVSQHAGLEAMAPLALDGPKMKFCLLPWSALQTIVARLGLVLNAARLVRTIDAKVVARLRRELGTEAYDFALLRAPLITSHGDPLDPELAGDRPLIEVLTQSGVNHLGLALGDLDPRWRARFKLKLPKALAETFMTPRGEIASDAAWQIVRKVVREVDPVWNASLD